MERLFFKFWKKSLFRSQITVLIKEVDTVMDSLVHLLLELFPLSLFVLFLHRRLSAGGLSGPAAAAADGALLVVTFALRAVLALAAAPLVLQREARGRRFETSSKLIKEPVTYWSSPPMF